jgi:orotate phosphoribosyltransferase
MFYLRRGLFNPDFNIAVARMFIYRMERIDPDFNFQITGLETAATPMLTAIPMVAKLYGLDINSFVVRKKRKEYGLMNLFEGRPNQKVSLMLDDLCNSGNSMAQCYRVLEGENMEVAKVAFVLVNKSNKGVHSDSRLNGDMYLPQDIQVLSLFTLDDFGLDSPSH